MCPLVLNLIKPFKKSQGGWTLREGEGFYSVRAVTHFSPPETTVEEAN